MRVAYTRLAMPTLLMHAIERVCGLTDARRFRSRRMTIVMTIFVDKEEGRA